MKDTLLAQSAIMIADDPKLIRIATITSFVHSLISFIYLMYIAASVLESNTGWWNMMISIISQYIQLISFNGASISVLIAVGIILLIGYVLLPPIGDAGIINYLDSSHRSVSKSIVAGLQRFFQMFEFNAAVWFFSITTFLVVVSRMYMMGIISSTFGIIIITIWTTIIFLVNLFLAYTKQIITLEGLGFFDAMQKSAWLAIENLGITLRYVLISMLMHVRIIINIVILIGVPMLLLYLASVTNIITLSLFQGWFLIVVLGLLCIVAYINAIIEAFFQTFWYKVYCIVSNPQYNSTTSDSIHTVSISHTPDIHYTSA
jgi:hypothetical protein